MGKWIDKKVRKLDWLDIGCIKWAVFAFALLLAKLCPDILRLKWQCYLVIAIFFSIRPFYRAYIKR